MSLFGSKIISRIIGFMSFCALILMVPQLTFFNLFHFVIFYNILTFLCSMHLNKFIDPDKFQEVVDVVVHFVFLEK